MPSVKTHTVSFDKKIKKVIEYSNNHLAKSIFYAQLLFQFGMVQMKNIALREKYRFDHLYSLITSKNIKNLQDIKRKKYDLINGSIFFKIKTTCIPVYYEYR